MSPHVSLQKQAYNIVDNSKKIVHDADQYLRNKDLELAFNDVNKQHASSSISKSETK